MNLNKLLMRFEIDVSWRQLSEPARANRRLDISKGPTSVWTGLV